MAEKHSLERRAKVLGALAHPSRLLLVEALEDGEKTVTDLTERVGADMSTVSRHLAVLRSAGIIASRKDANRVIHRLLTPCVTGFFQCVEQVIAESDKECPCREQGV